MAAFDTPWLTSMAGSSSSVAGASEYQNGHDLNPPTIAAFSPPTTSHSPSALKQRSTIIVYQKSPLLIATPPQITRALAYSHPFLLPLNKIVGLLSWTTGDPWESFLLVAGFWAVTLYGGIVIRWAGPILFVIFLILGMYSRRYSPLSSTGWTGEKVSKKGKDSAAAEQTNTKHQKSLDEIVDTLKIFTSRCNILLDPFVRLTDFLSTQRTATSATTRPALTALFIRILLITPLWIALSLPPLRLMTTKRVVLVAGTLFLSWHSRPARVSRTILWRSLTIRRIFSIITGLNISPLVTKDSTASPAPNDNTKTLHKKKSANAIAASLLSKRSSSRTPDQGIRFTFTLYENQRRWLGIGWTSSMLAYERAAWTDEHLNPTAPKEQFELPEVDGGFAKWRWVEGSRWQVEGAEDGEGQDGKGGKGEAAGWIYYDNKWRDGRRGQDSWGRYTRRRKWYRDAELIETTPSESMETPSSPTPRPPASVAGADSASVADSEPPPPYSANDDAASTATSPKPKRRKWFRRKSGGAGSEVASTSGGSGSLEGVGRERDEPEHDIHTPLRHEERESEWGMGEEIRMGLG